ncbi:MlaD family protein [Gordonia hankookensis]|uniref:MCE family protein n=1 Tax=Gordonia hankookensis TaxID=589403 RepID=A0ABR7WGW5_9ACTN|nr:MlaD family protein [Gordonia hankookensis]MBD1321986.1 MCE family protein [Gordonia hankookensis]NDZ94537.1 MCE family protein [Streptomyces sp. SID11726]NEB24208.1 MCE family protein [Streptomyces sp. SID6673]
MRSIPSLVLRVGAFALAMLLILFAVLRTIERPVADATDNYTALFTDANGLHPGDDVREFGVAVGNVTTIDLAGDTARVVFTMKPSQQLSVGAKLAIRYQNLTGQRYLDIQQSSPVIGGIRRSGSTIGTDHTVPSFDITTLFNGLQPVLADLSPADLNKFTGSMLAVVQGNGAGIGPALDAIEKLSTYTTDRQAVISTLVRNLSVVSEQIGGKSGHAVALIEELTTLFKNLEAKLPGLIDFAAQIPPVLDPLDHIMGEIGLVGDPNQPLDGLIDRAFPDPKTAIGALNRLPGFLQSLAGLAPTSGQLTCSKGQASPGHEIEVLLGGQRITLCRA